MNQISVLDNPSGVDMPSNKQSKNKLGEYLPLPAQGKPTKL